MITPVRASHAASVLVVEDVAVVAMAAQRVLEEAGYDVIGPVANERDADKAAAAHRPDLALIDIQLIPYGDGRVLARQLWERHGTPSLYVTGNPADAAPGPWCCGCLAKPASPDDLLTAVRIALALRAGQEPPGLSRQA